MWDCNYKVNPWNSLAILLYLQDDLTLTLEQDQSSSLCTQSSLLRLTTLLLLQVYYLMGTQLVISIRGKITEETSFLHMSLPQTLHFFICTAWPSPDQSQTFHFLRNLIFPHLLKDLASMNISILSSTSLFLWLLNFMSFVHLHLVQVFTFPFLKI